MLFADFSCSLARRRSLSMFVSGIVIELLRCSRRGPSAGVPEREVLKLPPPPPPPPPAGAGLGPGSVHT